MTDGIVGQSMPIWKIGWAAGVVVFDLEAFAGPGSKVMVLAPLTAKRSMCIGGRIYAGTATRGAAHCSFLKACVFSVHEFGIHESFRRKA